MYKYTNKSSKKFKVLDLEKTINDYESGKDTSIEKTNYDLLKNQLVKIKDIVGEEIE